MGRFWKFIVALIALATSHAVFAEVRVTFHSFNGSVLWGRYPHAFVSLDGTLDTTRAKVHENYGFSALKATPAVLRGPVKQTILVEDEKWLTKTNRHFTIPVSDATYWKIRAEVDAWRNAPGDYYDLDKRNCIHFVGKIAQIVGLKVGYPSDMLRKPRQWLNHITAMNPQLRAKPI